MIKQLKIDIKEFQKSSIEKYSFLNPFNYAFKKLFEFIKRKNKNRVKFN